MGYEEGTEMAQKGCGPGMYNTDIQAQASAYMPPIRSKGRFRRVKIRDLSCKTHLTIFSTKGSCLLSKSAYLATKFIPIIPKHMKNTFTFISPVQNDGQKPMRREVYEQSVELYGEGRYLEAFHCLLDYLNDSFRAKYGNAEGTEFHIPHGSIVVHIRIAEDVMHIEADFLNLPEKGRVAMLRQVADLNVNKLMLARFVKEGDRLKMEYHTPMAQSHPHKIYGVLQNICYIGDRFDDEFCTKFGATRCYEPQVTPYDADTVQRVHEGIQTVAAEALAALEAYNAHRAYGYSWNVLDTAFYQIAYFAQPQGQLGNDLEKAIDDMDAERPVEELVAKGMDFLKHLQAMPPEKLAEDLYLVDRLVSNRRSASLQDIQEVMKSVYEEANAAMQQGDYERSAVRLMYIYYETFFYNDMPEDVRAMLTEALQKAGGRPVEEASNTLYDVMDDIMEGNIMPQMPAEGLLAGNPNAQQMLQQAAAAAANMQKKMAEAMAGGDVAELQQKMTEAMARGDMAEYARLAGELQQKMMQNLFS